MSSEALERAEGALDVMAAMAVEMAHQGLPGSATRFGELIDGCRAALLAEVARLEQERTQLVGELQSAEEGEQRYWAALAVAREREQRLRLALEAVETGYESFYRHNNRERLSHGLHGLLNCERLVRAALVDEPAAASEEVAALLATVPDPRDDALLRIWTAARMNTAVSLRNFVLDVVPRVLPDLPAAATLAEPEGIHGSAVTAEAAPSGSASAAADEPACPGCGMTAQVAPSRKEPGRWMCHGCARLFDVAAADEPGETP